MNDENYKEATRDSYDSTAVAYSEKNSIKFPPEGKAAGFLSHLKSGASILDIGCGPGRDAKYFIAQGFQVTGIDISSKMVELASQNAPEATFKVMDIEQMDFPSNEFDAVWASASLLHVPKDKLPSVLKQIHMFLKKEGVFYVSVKKGTGETLQSDNRYGGVKKFWAYHEDEEFLNHLKNAGFVIVDHNVHEKSTSYQTHPWISVICKRGI